MKLMENETLLKYETLCEFFLLINKLKHLVARNIRFKEISGKTNVLGDMCTKGLESLGMKNPGGLLWQFMEFLTITKVLSVEDQCDLASGVSIDCLVNSWERLLTKRA